MEVEKLTQFFTITRGQLDEARQASVRLERHLQQTKLVHVEQISACLCSQAFYREFRLFHLQLLHKRIAMLQLAVSVFTRHFRL